MVIQHVCSTHHTIGELSELYIISILFIISTTFFWFLLFQINNMCSALAFTITIMAFRSGLSLSHSAFDVVTQTMVYAFACG